MDGVNAGGLSGAGGVKLGGAFTAAEIALGREH